MSPINNLVQELQAGKIGRRDFVVRALALGVSLSGIETILQSCGGGGSSSSGSNQPITVVYWTNVTPPSVLTSFFNGFTKQTGVKVNYFQLPAVFGDDVQKMTTYLSSGYTGLDVLWLDDFMTATFSNAGWLDPLDSVLSPGVFSAVSPAQLTLSTYNGHRYRVPANFGAVIFFYRKDLFDKEGISVPTNWNELVQAGQKLTKNGVYGIGLAGKNGNTELFNEMCYWMGQVGSDPLHLDSAGGRTALQFVYDLIHTSKIAPPDTVTADYTSLTTAFEDGKVAMWITWDGIYSGIARFPSVTKNYKLAVAPPPKGQSNNSTIIANWGWAINKYSNNKTTAAKFIDYATSLPAQTLLSQTGNTPSRTDALSDAGVQKALYQAKDLVSYVKSVPMHSRPITAQAQRISDAFEQYVNQYLNNRLSLEAAVTQGQQAVNQAMQG
jgi:ABC-type glycerol-3-phosphate transport system substrate-binding protein